MKLNKDIKPKKGLYKCNKCGLCECARPDSKIREAQEKFQKAWDNRKSSH